MSRIRKWGSILLILLAAIAAWVFFHAPGESSWNIPPADPAQNYEEAIRKAAKWMERDLVEPVVPETGSILLTHGHKTPTAYVFLHGLTSSPRQFRKLAEITHGRGANVFVPRMPFHGYRDPLNTQQRSFRIRDAMLTAWEAVDIAQGLGENVIVVGLSINGTVTAWLSAERDDIQTAAILSPLFAPHGMGRRTAFVLGNLFSLLPPMLMWWDDEQREKLYRPSWSYPRFPSRGISGAFQLSHELWNLAGRPPLQAKRTIIVLSDSDKAINPDVVRQFATRWNERSPGSVTVHTFPKEENVLHDFIDPQQPNEQTKTVYPRLLEWITE